ncbi:hypothetical protein LUZ61_000695 [Rhynchospora tenuis]|uniref:Cation/H+ exchanger domain-containing protein n=1 Tax=Rhynchospora tenuis TaxID=198213 RepID=A0AAD5ZFQ0_9POAL|nr:hypothetical protein LUZ61_000695 [Rhynchospora tenuis]
MVTSPTCPAPMKVTSQGLWQGDDPLHFALPLLILQTCIVIVFTRTLHVLIFKPLKQPRVIAEIIGGILLGPSAIGRNTDYLNTIFPKQSLTTFETVANVGLLFFVFLVGLELNLNASGRGTARKAIIIAIAGIALPFALGASTSLVVHATICKGARLSAFFVFMGASFSITAIPIVARILAEFKLLETEVGRMALSAAAINDITAWILLALAIALSGSRSPLVSVWILLTAVAYAALLFVFLRPILAWMGRRTVDGSPVKELYVVTILVITLASAFVTDMIGIHGLFGAFIVGFLVPKEGLLAGAIAEKVEDFTIGIFLPLFFATSGLKTDVTTIRGLRSWGLFLLAITAATVGKVGGTMIAASCCRLPLRDAVTLGFLMNTKGLIELIVLNIGKERKVLNDQTFAIMILMALFTTFLTTPVIMAINPRRRIATAPKQRTIEQAGMKAEFRILACYHSTRSIPPILNLIESSRGTRHQSLIVYTLHLLELSDSSSAVSLVQRAQDRIVSFWTRRDRTDEIEVAFESYQKLSAVSIRPLTAISNFDTIHEDIIKNAINKRAALIVIPFHKMLQADGSFESLGHKHQQINQRALDFAPCSVGILVDRGFGGTAHISASNVAYFVHVFFFGGPDDREVLTYAAQMAEHPGISVTLIRILPTSGYCREDNIAIDTFKEKVVARKGGAAKYEEVLAEGKEALCESIKMVKRCNIFLVGHSPPVNPLIDRTDCTELGPIGSYLASSESSTMASVLVIKRHAPQGDSLPLSEKLVEEAAYVDN